MIIGLLQKIRIPAPIKTVSVLFSAHSIYCFKQANFDVQPDQVKLEGPLKELGMYTVKFQLHEDIKGDVKVWVVPGAKQE